MKGSGSNIPPCPEGCGCYGGCQIAVDAHMNPESDFAICPACAGSVEHGANIAGWRANGEAIFHSVCHPNYDASDRESGFKSCKRCGGCGRDVTDPSLPCSWCEWGFARGSDDPDDTSGNAEPSPPNDLTERGLVRHLTGFDDETLDRLGGMEPEASNTAGHNDCVIDDAIHTSEPSQQKCGIAGCNGDHHPQDHNAITESEFARDDEFKALQKAHQRLKGRYKKLERTVTLKDQIIKTREFEISELRKGLR